MKRIKTILGRQYGRRSEANRAIRNFCNLTGAKVEWFFSNQLDYGCYEIEFHKDFITNRI